MLGPNIIGNSGITDEVVRDNTLDCDGVFYCGNYQATQGKYVLQHTTDGSGWSGSKAIQFSAQKSNNLYKLNTVQVASLKTLYLIKT